MNLLIRVLLYVPILYLIMIVYVGQRHDNARDTLRGLASVPLFLGLFSHLRSGFACAPPPIAPLRIIPYME